MFCVCVHECYCHFVVLYCMCRFSRKWSGAQRNCKLSFTIFLKKFCRVDIIYSLFRTVWAWRFHDRKFLLRFKILLWKLFRLSLLFMYGQCQALFPRDHHLILFFDIVLFLRQNVSLGPGAFWVGKAVCI